MPTGYELDAMKALVRIADALERIDEKLHRLAVAMDTRALTDIHNTLKTEKTRPKEGE